MISGFFLKFKNQNAFNTPPPPSHTSQTLQPPPIHPLHRPIHPTSSADLSLEILLPLSSRRRRSHATSACPATSLVLVLYMRCLMGSSSNPCSVGKSEKGLLYACSYTDLEVKGGILLSHRPFSLLVLRAKGSLLFWVEAYDEMTEMEGKSQRAFRGPERDFLLQWGNQKRLQCVKVREAGVGENQKQTTIRINRCVIKFEKDSSSLNRLLKWKDRRKKRPHFFPRKENRWGT